MNPTGESRVVSVAVEGIVDLAVASRLLSHVGRATGPAYVKGGKSPLIRKLRRLIEFADRHWRPDVAELRVDSLRRCIRALREL